MKKGYKDIKDDKILGKTKKTFQEWSKILDKFNVKVNGHTASAKYLKENYNLSPWWSQVITIKYEYEGDLRK